MSGTLIAPDPLAARTDAGWDSEVFILRGDDRAELRTRVAALAEFLEHNPAVSPSDLAATLSAELRPGGLRVAAIASTIADFRARLRRAGERLADPACHQIRDAAGLFFTDNPLSTQGTLAFLYPGEGAEYLHMLADLCGVFPEVDESFAWCDRVAAELGQPEESLRRVLHPPADITPAELALAEAKLRELGPSIFGVLVADLALTSVLENLKVPVAAMAGHSAGELAALLSAGALPGDAVLSPQLAEVIRVMGRADQTSTADNTALIAVGSGRKTVMEIASAIAGDAVMVAMDNCPHQCVAVGPTHLVAALETALHERGLVCERLPFNRPYHTPLFEPFMGPFRDMFAGVPFSRPHTPIYCGTTAGLFPEDPDAIRQLTVNHWVSPVEFTAMIEKMHADGTRLFVEVGPRGNLSSFVEDILRGRPFTAIPANVARRSGPTQINHLVAQLAVHGVPLNLNHLYSRRETQLLEWNRANHNGNAFSQVGAEDSRGFQPPISGEMGYEMPARDAAVDPMNEYLSVMEQFLDVQRTVMEAYLTGHAEGGLPDAGLFSMEDWFPTEGATAFDSIGDPVGRAGKPVLHSAPPLALIGSVEQFEAGREVVIRRVLDQSEDLYVDDHTLGGRGVSRVAPEQNGLPVMPMTFSLEAMAEAAALLAPGKVVIAIRNVRLYRWIPFDDEPTMFEVRARVAAVDPSTGVMEVKADVRDLGNSFVPDGANKPASEGVVVLADRYPEPPALLPFQLTNEKPCRSTVEDLRRNMFHGPLFQMVHGLGRIGKEGMEGQLQVRPRTGWFRSNPDPQVLLDPVLVDAAMHIIGAWHLEQPDWTGRILLPFEVKSVEFFGPPPRAGEQLVVRGHNEQESARHFRHGLELFHPDGKVWMRMIGAGYWRFYLPFGDVNFFGPKDEYYLSQNWPEAVPPSASTAPRRCYTFDPPPDLKQPVFRAAGVRVSMTARELALFQAWTGPDDGLNDWFFGRLVAKDAARAAWAERQKGRLFPADIESDVDATGRIVARPRGEVGAEPMPPVTFAIVKGQVAAFSAFAKYVGIGLVAVPKTSADDKEYDLSPEERNLLERFPDRADGRARLRASRAAVADALRSPELPVRISDVDAASGAVWVRLLPEAGSKHPDLNDRPLRVQTARKKDLVVATTLCETDRV